MMYDHNIHDNNVYAYSVHSDARRLTLHTEYRDISPVEYTDVVFSGVVAHHLECSLESNILFGIEEKDLGPLLEEYSWLFTRLKSYGWPSIQYDSLPDLGRQLLEQRVRAFGIESSYGLTGFVLCRSIDYVKREARAFPAPDNEQQSSVKLDQHGG